MEILTVEEVAEFLKTKPATVRKWLRDGELPGRKIGGEWRVIRDELEAFLRALPPGGGDAVRHLCPAQDKPAARRTPVFLSASRTACRKMGD